MPISATGRSKPATSRRRTAGFTLIEILVVMVILGLLAVTVNLTLPDPSRQAGREAVVAWRRQADLGARLAAARATPIAWEIRAGQARLMEQHEQLWLPLPAPTADKAAQGLALPDGFAIQRLEIEGQAEAGDPGAGRRIVFIPGQAPLFRLLIAGAGQHWRLEGLPNGRIELSEEHFD